MPQLGYPISMLSRDQWETESGGTTNLQNSIDDHPTLNSGDAIVCPRSADIDRVTDYTVSFGVTVLGAPQTLEGHISRVWADAAAGVGGTHDIRVVWKVGATVLRSDDLTVQNGLPVNLYENAWTTTQAGLISNYGTIEVHVTALADNTLYQAQVYRIQLQIPLVGFDHLDIDPSGAGLLVVPPHSGHYLIVDATGSGLQQLAGEDASGALVLDGGFSKAHG